MRRLLLFVWILGAMNLGSPREEQGGDFYSLHLVRALLKLPAGVSTGAVEKQLHRMGDRVAVALIKVLSDEDLGNPQTIRRSLSVVREAFAYPQLISLPEDKEPRVTLFFLSSVLEKTHDQSLKEDISQTRRFIEQETSSHKQAPPR